MTEKNFDEWNQHKQLLHSGSTEKKFYREREIWFCSVGINIGWEEDGKNATFDRPVLIIKKFWPSLFIGIPFTSKKQSGRSCFRFMCEGKKCIALFSQVRVFDARRLRRYITTIEEVVFIDLLNAFKLWL